MNVTILGLDVPVHDSPCVKVVEREEEGVKDHLHGLPLAQPPPCLVQQPIKVAPLSILLDEHHVVALLEGADEMDDVLVVQGRVKLDLPIDLEVVQLAEVLHVVYFQGHLLATLLVDCVIDGRGVASVHLSHHFELREGPELAGHDEGEVGGEGEHLILAPRVVGVRFLNALAAFSLEVAGGGGGVC